MQTKNFLNSNIRWKVGNGATIRVQGDSWLLRDDDFYVHTSMIQGLEDFNVRGLMNQNGSMWNLNPIHELLIPSYVIQIAKLPLGLFHKQDRMV